VVLDDDIYDMPRSQIYKARVGATIFNGTWVYSSGSLNL